MFGRSWACILMALWFLLFGLLAVSNVRFESQQVVMGFLAIAVAVLLLLNK